MPWLFLLAALLFPAVFLLWQPRAALTPRALRLRVAAAVVTVWMLMILWTVSPTLWGSGDMGGVERDYTPPAAPAAEGRQADTPEKDVRYDHYSHAPIDAGLVLMLGWVPGLVYAGLLVLARKGLERPPVEVIDVPPMRRRG
jgi:hypothetical protein